MKLGTIAFVGCMTVGVILAEPGIRTAPSLVMAQVNQTAPVEPQQNDRRTAIARVNPKRPIQVRVISRTNVPVVASMVPAVGDRPLAPGQSVIFGRLHTSYLSLPMDVQVSLVNTPDPNNPIGVSLDVKTVGNEIIVSVRTTPAGTNSAQTVDIDQQGLIYLY